MKYLILLALLCLPAYADKVCAAYDGDTITMCEGLKVRVWGVDAPELKQPMGKESRDFVRRLLIGREVDVSCNGKSYQRSVCRVAIPTGSGSLDLGSELVGWGYAYAAVRYSSGTYTPAERFAQKMNRGVWVLPDGGVRPWDWRKK